MHVIRVCQCKTYNFIIPALGIDSSLEFGQRKPVRYTLLLNKPFPRLEGFTITMWLRVYRSNHAGTVLSYINNNNMSESLSIESGPSLTLGLLGQRIVTNIIVNATVWFHFAWSWSSTGNYNLVLVLHR